MAPGRFGDGRRVRVGLLGGSFNPAHAGHLHVARGLARRLRLDQVWLLVSPGNPLKAPAGMASFADRLASARRIADGRRIIATGIEARIGTRFSVDTLGVLRRRFARVRFVWLMGADCLAQLPRWHRWMRLACLAPIGVHPRPGFDRAALSGQAAARLRARRVRAPGRLADASAPAFAFVRLPSSAISATALRATGLGLNTAAPQV